jgi:hypothetical protein
VSVRLYLISLQRKLELEVNLSLILHNGVGLNCGQTGVRRVVCVRLQCVWGTYFVGTWVLCMWGLDISHSRYIQNSLLRADLCLVVRVFIIRACLCYSVRFSVLKLLRFIGL